MSDFLVKLRVAMAEAMAEKLDAEIMADIAAQEPSRIITPGHPLWNLEQQHGLF